MTVLLGGSDGVSDVEQSHRERADDDGLRTGAAAFEIGVLGALTVHRAGEHVPIRRGRPRVLLSSLVLARGRPVSPSTLIDHLWGDRLPSDPTNALQSQMSYLRRALGGPADAPIATGPLGYVLGTNAGSIDVDRFETLLTEARAYRATESAPALDASVAAFDAALALWRGDAYADVAGLAFADAEIVRLEELRLSAEEARVDALLARGRTSDAISALSAMVQDHPLRERRQELLVLALYRDGRQSDALRAFARARRTLADELGIDPGPALRELERKILAQDRSLNWVAPGVAAAHRTRRDPLPALAAPAVDEGARIGRPAPGRAALIGRTRELERVVRLLDERRLVTLTGPGGAGKTRLALAAADAQPSRRVQFVDLAGVGRPGDVDRAVAIAIGVKDPISDAVAALVTTMRARRTLLVLDTCERVREGVAALVERLLAAAPELDVLATSRRPIGAAGELAWPVPPLAVPGIGGDPRAAAAFELFVERAREVAPDFAPDDDDVEAISELCRALDGLPLAIELAAAQMDVLCPAVIRDQIRAHRSVGARTVGPERQRTLGATTDWSLGLLDDDERDMLHRLAVFAPGFDHEAAIAVAGDSTAASATRFVTLLRSSLVAHDGVDGRYRLLDSVRAHLVAIDTDADRRAQARRRHAEHYAELAAIGFSMVRTSAQVAWLRRLEADQPNIGLALDWCFGPDGDERLGARLAGDLAWVWTLTGNLVDALGTLERAAVVETEPLVRARALLGVALLAAPLGDHLRARSACLDSADLGRTVGDDATVAAALLTLGVAQWAAGELDAAAATHDEAIAIFDQRREPWGAAICRTLRARTAHDGADLDRMRTLLDVAIDDARRTGDAHVIALVHEQLTRYALARGRLDRAAASAAACLESNELLGYQEGICAALGLLAKVRIAQGETVAARNLQIRALRSASRIGHIGAVCTALEAIAEIDAASGDRSDAARLLAVAHRTRMRRGLPVTGSEGHRLEHLRRALGSTWDDVAGEATSISLADVLAGLIDLGMDEDPGG